MREMVNRPVVIVCDKNHIPIIEDEFTSFTSQGRRFSANVGLDRFKGDST